MKDIDFDVVEFSRLLDTLQEELPITRQLEEDIPPKEEVWYSSQREHMVGWFADQVTKGAGAYTRKVGNSSAKTTYNRLLNPKALIWIAEALGAETTLVAAVADEVLNVEPRSRCRFIREHLPWAMIAELAAEKMKVSGAKQTTDTKKKPPKQAAKKSSLQSRKDRKDPFDRSRFSLNEQPDDDFDVVIFAQLLSKLEQHLPISDAYEEAFPQKRGRWWDSQRAHMVAWFAGQNSNGGGAYTRENPNLSAKRCYSRLLSDGGLLWMNEAMGIDSQRVQAAAEAAAKEPDHRKRCGVIRKHLPWKDLVALAKTKTHLLKW